MFKKNNCFISEHKPVGDLMRIDTLSNQYRYGTPHLLGAAGAGEAA